jgi:hypothetical protein
MKSIASAIVVSAGVGLCAIGVITWPHDSGGIGLLAGGTLCIWGLLLLTVSILRTPIHFCP